ACNADRAFGGSAKAPFPPSMGAGQEVKGVSRFQGGGGAGDAFPRVGNGKAIGGVIPLRADKVDVAFKRIRPEVAPVLARAPETGSRLKPVIVVEGSRKLGVEVEAGKRFETDGVLRIALLFAALKAGDGGLHAPEARPGTPFHGVK